MLPIGGAPQKTTIGRLVVGGTATQVLHVDASGLLGGSTSLTYDDSTKRLTVGTGGAGSAGFTIGNSTSNGASLWATGVTLGSTTYALFANGTGDTILNASGSGILRFRHADSDKITQAGTPGAGPSITAGTATTDVSALSSTQTWNAAGVTFVHEKHTITDTASAAGSLAVQYLGGASGTTNLFSVDKSATASTGAIKASGLVQTYREAALTNRTGIFGDTGSGSFAAIASGGTYGIGSSATDANTVDTAISRVSAGVLGVGTGAAGSIAGTLRAAVIDQNTKATWTNDASGSYIIAATSAGRMDIGSTDGQVNLRVAAVNRYLFSSTALAFDAANTYDIGNASTELRSLYLGTALYLGTSNVVTVSATAPTIASGGCTSPTIVNNNGTARFEADVGTSCSGSQPLVFTLPAATTGWNCTAQNVSNPATSAPAQTSAVSTTSVTITSFSRTTGLAQAWTDGDNVVVSCLGG